MSDDEKAKDEVVKNLRACLVSVPGGVELAALQSDYQLLIGEPVPFRKFGHASLKQFLESIPDFFISTNGPTCIIDVRSNAKSGHISALVDHQKKSKKTTKAKRGKPKSSYTMRKPTITEPRFAPAPQTSLQRITTMKPSRSLPIRSNFRENGCNYNSAPKSRSVTNNGTSNSNGSSGKNMNSSHTSATTAQKRLETVTDKLNEPPSAPHHLNSYFHFGPNDTANESQWKKNSFFNELTKYSTSQGWSKPLYGFIECRITKMLKACILRVPRNNPSQKLMKDALFSSYPLRFKVGEKDAALEYVAKQAYDSLVKRGNSHENGMDGSVLERIRQANYLTNAKKPIPRLSLSSANEWNVYVTSVMSSNQVCVKLIDNEYTEKFDRLIIDMETYYAGSKPPVDLNFQIGGFYALLIGGSYVRVLALADRRDCAEVFLIDHGEISKVPFSSLRSLADIFYLLPAQVIICDLMGLEVYSFPIQIEELDKALVELLAGKPFVAKVHCNNPISVVLYETSGAIDLDMNQIIKTEIVSKFSGPVLSKNGVKEMTVSHVEDCGIIHLQEPSFSLDCLNLKMKEIQRGDYSAVSICKCAKDRGDFVFLRRDKELFRVAINNSSQIASIKYVEVSKIDKGGKLYACTSELFAIPMFTELMNQIPPQALTVKLGNVGTLTTAQKVKLLEMVPVGSVVMTRVLSLSGGVPSVEISIRSPTSDLYISVNESIATLPVQKSSENRGTIQSQTTVSDSVDKHVLKLPALGDNLDVLVTDVTSPDKFIIQRLHSSSKLDTLELSMAEHYESRPNEQFIRTQGELVAVKHRVDGKNYWKRGQIVRKARSLGYVVHMCDYGSLKNVLQADIWKLDARFLSLPCMAVTAKLHGILPKYGFWSTDDCDHFRSMIHTKKVVCVVKDITHDSATKFNQWEVEVIDPSAEMDVSIADLLVSTNRAVYKN